MGIQFANSVKKYKSNIKYILYNFDEYISSIANSTSTKTYIMVNNGIHISPLMNSYWFDIRIVDNGKQVSDILHVFVQLYIDPVPIPDNRGNPVIPEPYWIATGISQ